MAGLTVNGRTKVFVHIAVTLILFFYVNAGFRTNISIK